MIPLNLLLLAWAWFGRVVFGVFGWFALVLLPVVLVVGVALLITTILALTQPTRPRRLSRPEVLWQWMVWLGLLVFGLFLPDFGDTEESHVSVLTRAFGRSDALLSVSYTVAFSAGALVVVAWVGLLISLIAGRRRPASGIGGALA